MYHIQYTCHKYLHQYNFDNSTNCLINPKRTETLL